MAGIAHIGTAFALKRVLPSLSIWIVILATELLEILWILFYLVGLDRMGDSPWSHSLGMAVVWGIIFGAGMGLVYRSKRDGLLLGLLVFSHWIVDWMTHPMGAVFGRPGQPPNLPLFFGNGPHMGLGLYNYSLPFALAIEFGVTAIGVALFLALRRKKSSKAASPGE